ncbi:unnamed protein product, partial [Rotaria socialis]
MTGIIKRISKWLKSEIEISEAANYVGSVFHDDSDEQSFFDVVFSRFENYDQSNQAHGNRTFSEDIDFIIQCAIDSLTSSEHLSRHSKQIHVFFYIYRRTAEYNEYKRRCNTQLKEFQEKLLERLGHVFESTKGCDPNLSTTNKDLIERIDIRQHLATVTEIKDIGKLNIFFALCKLSFQSSLVMSSSIRLQWMDVLKMCQWNISVIDFVSQYLECKSAFEQCPLDISALIYLTRKAQSSTSVDLPTFDILHSFLNDLNLDYKEFYGRFLSIFGEGIRKPSCKQSKISQLFRILSTEEDLFPTYLSTYASGVSPDHLWELFLNLSANGDINEIMQKHLSSILTQRMQYISIEVFKHYYVCAECCLPKIKDENRQVFVGILDTVLQGFLSKQRNDQSYSCQFTEYHLKEFLNIALRLSPTHSLQHPSCLLIIRHLLFKRDNYDIAIFEKIKRLFARSNSLDRNLFQTVEPASIIKDEWFIDYMFHIPNDWFMLSRYDYDDLAAAHQNNSWSLYIWSRLIQLSLSKVDTNKWNETVAQLNHWMINVERNKYTANDTLTIIFVNTVFDMAISKNSKSVLFAPNIGSILKYILDAKQNNDKLIDIKQVDDFIQKVNESIKDILSLNSTRKTYNDLLCISNFSCFLPFCDLKAMLISSDPQRYKFPVTPLQILTIVSDDRPNDIDISITDQKETFFCCFIQQVVKWLEWFDKFIDIFQHVIEWLRVRKLQRAEQLLSDIHTIKDDSMTNVIKAKTVIQDIIDLLKPFKNLHRLCYLLNCMNSFENSYPGTLTSHDQWKSHIEELKRVHSNNTFTVAANAKYEHPHSIGARRVVHWSLACERLECNISIEYRINTPRTKSYNCFSRQKVPLDKKVLKGEFKTQRSGNLVITIDNQTGGAPRTIWYQIKTMHFSTCHLFDGFFSMLRQQYFQQSNENIQVTDLSDLIDRAFEFIDSLLNGDITLEDMEYLKTVFHDKNI